MKIATITGSISRQAGGLFPAIQRLNQSLLALPNTQISLLTLEDEFTTADAALWQPIVPESFPAKGPTAFGFSPELNHYLLQSDCDLVHQHGLWQFISVAVSQWHSINQRPYLISPHGMLDPWALANSRWKKQIAAFCFESKNLHGAACLHALCEAEARAMREYGLKNPICIIPNGIDPPDARSQKSAGDLLDSNFLRLFSQQKVLLYLGRLHPKKGLANLLCAWAQAQSRDEWNLAIAGWDQGQHEAELKSLASELGIAWIDGNNMNSGVTGKASVVFLGPQFNEAKAACYQNCAAFILPSFSEGLPMVVLEAWSYGKPVLMTPQCNLPEGFAANAAIRIEPSVESIAAGLTELFRSSDSDLRALGDNGRHLAATRFTWPKVATDMRSVYEWLLGEGAKPDCVVD